MKLRVSRPQIYDAAYSAYFVKLAREGLSVNGRNGVIFYRSQKWVMGLLWLQCRWRFYNTAICPKVLLLRPRSVLNERGEFLNMLRYIILLMHDVC